MAETSPPPTAGAESCSEDQARGGEQRPEDEAGPPLASPAEQSEPGSPVAAPFFLLYPGDGGAGFAARPPSQQRTWRTPPSPGSPLPFLLLSYPSGGGGGGGSKHREWRWEGGTRPGRAGPAPRSSASRWVPGAGCRPAGALRKPLFRGVGGRPRPGTRLFTSKCPQAAGSRLARPPQPSRAERASSPASHVLPGSRPRVPAGSLAPGSVGRGGAQRPGSPAGLPSAGSGRRGPEVGVAAVPPLPGRLNCTTTFFTSVHSTFVNFTDLLPKMCREIRNGV